MAGEAAEEAAEQKIETRGRKRKDWKRVNIKLSPANRERTEDIDRSKLINELLDKHFAE